MAKSEYYYLKGKVEWCRPFVPDQWGNYKSNLFPDKESLEIIRKLKQPLADGTAGIKNTIMMNDTGDEYIILKRPVEREYGGVMKGFAPPEVLDKDNLPLRDTNIGNGSDTTNKVLIYRHRTGPGGKSWARAMRWEAIRVDNLVPFDGKKDFTDEEGQAIQGVEQVSPGF